MTPKDREPRTLHPRSLTGSALQETTCSVWGSENVGQC